MLKKLHQFHLAMIEQPLQHDDLINHAELQSKIGTPVCLDESITTPEQAQQAIRIKACKYINIKYGRVGITPPANPAALRGQWYRMLARRYGRIISGDNGCCQSGYYAPGQLSI